MSGYNIGQAVLYSKSRKPLSPSERELLTCPYCQFILRDPYQAIECGHRYCYSCVEKILITSFPQCVVDGEEISRSEVRKDKGCTKELASLLVDCPGREFGCEWKGFLPDVEIHLDDCAVIALCRNGCGKYLCKSEKIEHETRECMKRLESCPQCDQEVPVEQMAEHLSKCELDYCSLCSEQVPKRKMKEHSTVSCSELSLACPVDSCSKKGNLTTLNKHVNQHHSFHLVTLVLKQREENKKKDEQIKDLESVTNALNEGLKRLKEQVYQLQEQLQYAKTASLSSADSSPSAYSYDPGYGSYASSVSSTRGDSGASLIPRLKAIEQKVDVEVEPALLSLQQSYARMDEVTQTVQETVTRHAVSMEEIKLRQDVLDVKTTGGVFIWKIPDIRKRLRDAVERRTLSLYSPPFYSSPHGYRMCVRAYLNGDGSGKGTHFSVFFVLMRSEHDSLLRWPFSQPVTFTLINQAFPSKSISETFLPDTRSPSFQQPRSEMNVASGFPRFAPQSLLHEDNYTKGNSIFIKCRVDTQGLVCE